MSVLIRDPEADSLIRQLAERTGETLTQTVRIAVEERLRRLPSRRGRIDREKLAAAQALLASLPRINEHLTDDEVIGYDDDGGLD